MPSVTAWPQEASMGSTSMSASFAAVGQKVRILVLDSTNEESWSSGIFCQEKGRDLINKKAVSS